MDALFEGVYLVDKKRKITFWSKGAERITGYSSAELVGKSCADNILIHIDQDGNSLCLNGCPMSKCMSNGAPQEARIFLHHKDGHRIPVLVRVTPIRDAAGEIVGSAEIFHDNRVKVATSEEMEELRRLARLDHLTQFPNRRFAEVVVSTKLSELKAGGAAFGILFADVDHFKDINDGWGHDIGDRVLKMVASTLFNNLRSTDHLCRWGGEEFLVVVSNENESQLFETADKLRMLVENSAIFLDGSSIRTTVSVGATFARRDDTMESLIQRADRLMYRSKFLGRNQVSMWMEEG